MKNLRLYGLILLAATSFSLQAQIILTGSVKGADGLPLTGSSVLIKNTLTGTTADGDGIFKLQIENNQKASLLVVSFIGFLTQEIPIGDRTAFDVVLVEDATQLSAVIVTGYTVQEKGKITGAVSTVTEQMITRLPVASIDQALQGRAPGVVVTQNTGAPGEGVSVRIRGAGSINSGNNPLYVVDGIPTVDINTIATQDIASITVLKDAGATAIYGSRAANGVVLVTTKTGASSSPKIQFSSQVGVQSPSRKIDMTNTTDYVTVYNEAANHDNVGKPAFLLRPLITNDIQTTLANVDYIDAIMRKGILQSHSISVSGGEGKTRYFISGNYFDQQGIIKSSDYTRISSRINIDTSSAVLAMGPEAMVEALSVMLSSARLQFQSMTPTVTSPISPSDMIFLVMAIARLACWLTITIRKSLIGCLGNSLLSSPRSKILSSPLTWALTLPAQTKGALIATGEAVDASTIPISSRSLMAGFKPSPPATLLPTPNHLANMVSLFYWAWRPSSPSLINLLVRIKTFQTKPPT
jgi:TonB-dependent SusC/RagA subfamily outer membrane receptor